MSDNKDLLGKIEALEKRVAYLENKPAEYVPPPTYGPLPTLNKDNEIIFSDEVKLDIREAVMKLQLKMANQNNTHL